MIAVSISNPCLKANHNTGIPPANPVDFTAGVVRLSKKYFIFKFFVSFMVDNILTMIVTIIYSL